MTTTAVIIQARMTSTRLPGKVLKPLCGEMSMLEVVIRRLMRSNLGFLIIVATTTNSSDDCIELLCQKMEVAYYRGSENDVLDRYYQAALLYCVSDVIRITSDCPLIDSAILDRLYYFYQANHFDYASNILERTYPRGLDAEIFSFKVLSQIHELASLEHEREHVTSYIYTHPSEFKMGSLVDSENHSQYRLTVDTQQDWDLVSEVLNQLTSGSYDLSFSYSDIIHVMKDHPERGNQSVVQKYDSQTAYQNSI